MTITLPWPSLILSPNARAHWAEIARVKKGARRDGLIAAKAAGQAQFTDGPINIRLTFHCPDRRARDEDNLIARMKASLDGVAAGLGVDDSRFRLAPLEFGPPKKPGCVVVEVWQ